jgi:primosomal protein N' (replication factor Y)
MGFCKIVISNSLQTFPFQGTNYLSYAIPDNLRAKLKIGSFVVVPLRKQKENGLVIDIFDELGEEERSFKIREIEDLISDEIIYSQDLVELIKFTADYYASSCSEVLQAVLPAGIIRKPEKRISLNRDIQQQLADGKTIAELFPKLADSPILTALSKTRRHEAKFARLQALCKFNKEQVNKAIKPLEAKGLITLTYINPSGDTRRERKKLNPLERLQALDSALIPDLTQEQAAALDYIRSNASAKFLLHGVTGSGKTEIYLRSITDCFSRKQSSIILVPEISLAPQLAERLAQRFGAENVLIWHSALSASEREYTWNELLLKEPKVIVGARSAIFAPVHNLGLIVIDEEHENSYKQDSPAPRYQTRTLAEKRAEFAKCPLVFGSATPSVELYYKASSDAFPGYHLLELKNRIFQDKMPDVTIVDMRSEFLSGNKNIFSKLLNRKIGEALEQKEQIILFLNKRGSATHVFCRTCGYIYKCPNCESKIVYHETNKLMICHHCNHTEAHPRECPACNMPSIKFFGLGTQKLEEETRKTFPQARVARLDSDVSKTNNAYIKIWNDFRNGDIDILVGTQMIAKGFDIPNLNTVGVISADSCFTQLDYMADERAFQLLTQVAGRAGRHQKSGHVIFQSYQPERTALIDAQKQDYADFYHKEIQARADFNYPPFSTLIRFLSSAEDEDLALETMNNFHELLSSKLPGCEILGPSPCLIARLNRKYRFHLLVKILKQDSHDQKLKTIKENYLSFKPNEGIVFTIDVDNISLY